MDNAAQSPRVAKALKPWARPLAIATAVVFCISTLFPIVASLTVGRRQVPRFWGVLDVVIFLSVGDRIVWSVGLVGIGWRVWLVLYALPAWITALKSRTGSQ